MSTKRDFEFYTAKVKSDTISITSATSFNGKGINTKGFDGGIVVGFELSRTFVPASEEIEYKFQESDDNSAWSDVPEEAILPTRKQPTNLIEEPVSPGANENAFIQTAGCISNKEFSRVVLTCNTYNADIDIRIVYSLKPNLSPFTGWSTVAVPGDGLP